MPVSSVQRWFQRLGAWSGVNAYATVHEDGPANVAAIPVWLLGRDYPDDERATWEWGDFVTAGAFLFPELALVAQTGDLWIQRAWCYRAGAVLQAHAQFQPVTGGGTSGQISASDPDAPLRAFVRSGDGAFAAAPASLSAAAGEVLVLPLGPVILRRGMELVIRGTVAASTLGGGFAWRNA